MAADSASPDRVQDRIAADLAQLQGRDGPMYSRIAATLRGLIETGALRGGDMLPSERDLASTTGHSRVTVRKAFDLLCQDGLVTRRQGAGSFVTPQIHQPLSVLVGFTEDMKRRGATTTSRLLKKSVGPPDPADMLKLGLSPADAVFRLSRVRLSEGEPLAIEHAVIPAWAVAPESVRQSLYAALRASGHMPVRALQRLQAGIATPQEARLLGLGANSAVLRIERRSFLENGRVIEVTTSAYRGDRYDFIAELALER